MHSAVPKTLKKIALSFLILAPFSSLDATVTKTGSKQNEFRDFENLIFDTYVHVYYFVFNISDFGPHSGAIILSLRTN